MSPSAFSQRIVFCFWTDDNHMSNDRHKCLLTIKEHIGCTLELVTKKTVEKYILEKTPFHPAYDYLSPTQKSDYLRCYFMHHYGGGYCDIKQINHDWNPFFDELERNQHKWALGYQEVGEYGVAILPGEAGELLRKNWQLLLGNGAYIFKPDTPLTREWLHNLHQVLDYYFPVLQKNPACFPQDCLGAIYNNEPTGYPIPWSGVGGSILHPLHFKYADKLLQGLPLPSFENYR